MRVIAVALILVLLPGGPAAAFAVMDGDAVRAALDYGHGGADMPLAGFLLPWSVYEEKAMRIDGTAERATVYTPFLLVAADARDRALGGGTAAPADAEKVLGDYGGDVVFGVTLFGREPGFAAKVSVGLRQGRKKLKPQQVVAPVAEAVAGRPPGKGLYRAQVYVYFSQRDVDADGAATLTASAADGRRRSFRFALEGYR